MGRVENKVAIVTGGSVGLGRAQAMLLAKEGARVVVTDVKEKQGKECVASIQAAGGEAIFLKHDVSQEQQWKDVVAKTLDTFGELDVLVNNAGILLSEPIISTSLKDWRQLMSVNLDGVFLGMKHAIPAMLTTDTGGSIINLSSIAGLIGVPNLAAYNSSKGGVRLMTKVAALEHAADKIRVNSIHPAYIWTDMVKDFLESQGDLEAGEKAAAAVHPLGRMGEPNDIAYGVLYLASDEAKFVTGSELVIDGGYTAQ